MFIHKIIGLPEILPMTKVQPMNVSIANARIALLVRKLQVHLDREDAKKAADVCMQQHDVKI